MGGDLAKGGVGFEIEDEDCAVSAAIGDEAASCLGNDGDTVGGLLARNVAESLAGLGIDDHSVGAAGDEEAMSRGIDREIVPSAIAAHVEGVCYLPVGLGDGGQGGCEQQECTG